MGRAPRQAARCDAAEAGRLLPGLRPAHGAGGLRHHPVPVHARAPLQLLRGCRPRLRMVRSGGAGQVCAQQRPRAHPASRLPPRARLPLPLRLPGARGRRWRPKLACGTPSRQWSRRGDAVHCGGCAAAPERVRDSASAGEGQPPLTGRRRRAGDHRRARWEERRVSGRWRGRGGCAREDDREELGGHSCRGRQRRGATQRVCIGCCAHDGGRGVSSATVARATPAALPPRPTHALHLHLARLRCSSGGGTCCSGAARTCRWLHPPRRRPCARSRYRAGRD
mmetsp:Transcript_16359/g.51996  ORF Transcript_16359/g.51996 Transcript_16359/m.51996 type:complete len:281 (-) Transcript_16359:931-1773(-)